MSRKKSRHSALDRRSTRHYPLRMPRYTNTAEQNEMARQYIQAAQERIKAGTLYVGTVRIKAVTKANADKIFPPGCAAIVRRFLGVQSVPM